ncbi:MAG: preprotein translocase subunit YajC [Clostridia bacterium]|nr:preprotein translocase subunit YajC [Clostridia bacterium]
MNCKQDFLGLVVFLSTLIVIFGAITIRMILLTKKKKELYNNLKIGTHIVTVGGICGKIMAIKYDKDMTFVLLQTGDTTHKSYFTVDLESIYKVIEDPKEILKDEIMVSENPTQKEL